MLILSLTAVARAPVRLHLALPADLPLWRDAGLVLDEPLTADLEARSVGEGILVRGEMSTRVAAECRRCLTPVHVDLRQPVDLLYEPLSPEDELDLSGEVYPLPDRGDELDLAPALREQLILKVPDFVLCTESCRGLCPHCGAELNRTSCGCVGEAKPSAWDALKSIRFD